MSRYWGIALAVLALTLAACSGSPVVNSTQPSTNRPSTPPTSTTTSSAVAVAHPKYVDEDTPCQEVITAADVTAATGTTATPSLSMPFQCYYDLKKSDGSDGGVLTISFFTDRTAAPTAVLTTVAGNAALEQRQGEVICTFYVVLDERPLDAKGGVLSVSADLRVLVDPCKAARELVEKGFARLPDA